MKGSNLLEKNDFSLSPNRIKTSEINNNNPNRINTSEF